MPATNALSAYNTLLKIGDGGGPEVFTTIGEIFNIDGPELIQELIDATHMESPGRNREKIAGLRDTGPCTFDINWIPDNAVHAGFITDYEAGTLRNFEMILPDTAGTKWEFSAFITSHKPTAGVEDKLMSSVVLTVSGKPTLA